MSLTVRKLLAELLGAYVLVGGGSMAILASNASGATTAIVAIALGFGLALLAALYAFGEVSGGHFNPAVSLAMVVDGRMNVVVMIEYWIAQVAGAVLASLTVLAVFDKQAVADTATTIGWGFGVWEAFLLEAVFTAIFLAVILKVTTSADSAATAFLAIGFTLVVIHIALIPFTGTSVNPARSLGPGIVGGVWEDQWVYWVAPLVGAVVGWGAYRAVTTGPKD